MRGAAARSQIAAEKNAIVAAQMAVRRWVLRRKWRRMEAERREAAAAAAAEETRRVAEAETNAAVFIQSAYRGAAARGRYAEERAAVIRAQLATRRWLLRSRCLRRREAREAAEAAALEAAEAKARLDAVVFLQARARGAAARGRYEADRAAVIAAQMAVRRWALRRKWKRNADARRAAEAAAAAAEEAARTHAATFIQSRVRGKAARERYSRDLAALRRLQMAVRRWVLRRKWKRLESERLEKEAALEAAKIAEAEARAQANAATLVQAHVRGMLARGQYSRDRELVIKLQMAARRWVLRRKWKRLEKERLEKEAALEAAKIAEAEARAQANAATLVQAHVRGMLARGQYSRDRELVIKLQMAARRWVLRRKWKRLEKERLEKEAALEAAKIAEAEASARNRAAVIIQSRLRGAICRARYAHDRAGILHTQFLVRAWLIRRRLRAAVDAAVTHNQRSPRPGRFSIRVVHADRLKNTQILGGWKPYVWIRCGEREVRSRAVPNASYLSSVETLQCVVDGDELKLEVEVRKSHPMFSDTVAGKGTAPLDDAYARGNARARVALVDKRGTPGAGDLTLRISFEAASRPGRRSLGGHGRIAAEPHGRLHDATREARSLEHSKRSGEGGSRTNDDGTPSRAARDVFKTVGAASSAHGGDSDSASESESDSERYVSAPNTPGASTSNVSVPGTSEEKRRGRRSLFSDSKS